LYFLAILLDRFCFCETHFTTYQRFVADQCAISPFLGGVIPSRNFPRTQTKQCTRISLHIEALFRRLRGPTADLDAWAELCLRPACALQRSHRWRRRCDRAPRFFGVRRPPFGGRWQWQQSKWPDWPPYGRLAELTCTGAPSARLQEHFAGK